MTFYRAQRGRAQSTDPEGRSPCAKANVGDTLTVGKATSWRIEHCDQATGRSNHIRYPPPVLSMSKWEALR